MGPMYLFPLRAFPTLSNRRENLKIQENRSSAKYYGEGCFRLEGLLSESTSWTGKPKSSDSAVLDDSLGIVMKGRLSSIPGAKLEWCMGFG